MVADGDELKPEEVSQLNIWAINAFFKVDSYTSLNSSATLSSTT
jgi:hypothetical protein